MKRVIALLIFAGLLPMLVYMSCGKQADTPTRNFISDNVVIVFMDGPRYSETWGQLGHPNIPHMSRDMAPHGVVFTNFRNYGPTNTVNGHAALTTGFYQSLNNGGLDNPAKPSIFQQFIKTKNAPSHKAWIIASKDKLEVLGNSSDSAWHGQYLPRTDCGNSGLFTGYRHDSITFRRTMEVLEDHKPSLLLVNFREPDFSGHYNEWKNYLKGIQQTDEYAYKIWSFLRTNPHYKDNTTFILTNDHGRHLDGQGSGFVNHGDQCEGCTHINLYVSGPDTPEGLVVDKEYELTDLNTTIRGLLQISKDVTQGETIVEVFK